MKHEQNSSNINVNWKFTNKNNIMLYLLHAWIRLTE